MAPDHGKVRRMRRTTSFVFVSVTGLAAVALVAGCSTSNSGPSTSPSSTGSSSSPSSSVSPSPTGGQVVEFSADLSSQYSRLTTAGPSDSLVYGYNQLEGYSKINGKQVRVRMQGMVDYNEGSGPLTGFLTLHWSDGTELGLRQDGTATYDAAAKSTALKANLTVVGGTRQVSGTTGGGSFTGSKRSTSGSSIRIAVTLNLQGAPAMLVGEDGGSPTPSASYSATILP